MYHSENVFVRRSYVNSRDYADLPGCSTDPDCYSSINRTRGDEGIVCYHSQNCVIENSISEGNNLMSITGPGAGNPPNHILGSISIYDSGGLWTQGGIDNNSNAGATIENSVGVNALNFNAWARSTVDTTFKNLTLYNSAKRGAVADRVGTIDPPDKSITMTNVLSFNNASTEFFVDGTFYPNWHIEYSNGGSGGSYYTNENIADATGHIQHSLAIAPTLMGTGPNQCIVYVPGGHDGRGGTNPKINGQSSNMAGAGKNGEDIGANIVYRYYDSELTDEKLWDQTTGQFPCGTTVSGVNDDASFPDSSCTNVHKRLNVGVNGCPIP
jgi:hypothetical protein